MTAIFGTSISTWVQHKEQKHESIFVAHNVGYFKSQFYHTQCSPIFLPLISILIAWDSDRLDNLSDD